MTTAIATAPTLADPADLAILAVSEDRLLGFQREPFAEVARQTGIPAAEVAARIRAMLETGVIRRVRQTLLATNIAKGALVAWRVPPERLAAAFDVMFEQDPFSGHVVIRSTDSATTGSDYRLWTTVKVPQGYSIERHCEHLAACAGATAFRAMPAKRLFVLGVGHVRRRTLEPGARSDAPGEVRDTALMALSAREWRVLTELKREFEPHEIRLGTWAGRAAAAGVPLDQFYAVAESLDRRRVLGRFSTFLEHVKPLAGGDRVTRYNGLFHWAVAPGQEVAAGQEVGRHEIITHAYWREGGPEFGNVNIMAVAHGLEKDRVLAHKAAIDAHLAEAGIGVSYTNVFWGGRSEIKPSEISPVAYREWCAARGIDADAMRESAGGEAP